MGGTPSIIAATSDEEQRRGREWMHAEPRSTCQRILAPRPSAAAGVPLGHQVLVERASKRELAGDEKLPRPAVPVLPLVVGDHRRSCGQRTRPTKVRGVERSGRGAMGAPAVLISKA